MFIKTFKIHGEHPLSEWVLSLDSCSISQFAYDFKIFYVDIFEEKEWREKNGT